MLTHRLLYLGLVGSLMSATERCVIQPKRYSSPMLSGRRYAIVGRSDDVWRLPG